MQTDSSVTGPYFIGVDVGTSSVRAALFNHSGSLLTSATHPIQIFEPEPDFYEQSSDNIWTACCQVVQIVGKNVNKTDIHGIGFDATCSLVVVDKNTCPLSVNSHGMNNWNVIMWMDHRAGEQADRINDTHHNVLKYVGNTISLEMETPKLLWLKENLKLECWENAGHFFDLPDFLTWKATGSYSRSLCCLASKWTYQANNFGEQGWDASYLSQIGLEDLVAEKYSRIGTHVNPPGQACGQGLTDQAAKELGLEPGTSVSTSIIDAHAGGLGALSCSNKEDESLLLIPLTSRLALIGGTSTCHMAISEEALFVPGVWGPYYSAVVPGFWLNEGGQSAAGKLIDHVVETHVAYSWVHDEAKKSEKHVHSVLNEILENLVKKRELKSVADLTKHLHVWPDYHGNRSPVADASLRGMISGLSLSSGAEELACLYLATIQALAYGTKHIICAMNEAGHKIQVLTACGGLAKNSLFVQTHADVTGMPIILPHESESVLLGGAILAACAAKHYTNIQEAMSAMGGTGDVIKPEIHTKRYHEKKYAVFIKMLNDQKQYKIIMDKS